MDFLRFCAASIILDDWIFARNKNIRHHPTIFYAFERPFRGLGTDRSDLSRLVDQAPRRAIFNGFFLFSVASLISDDWIFKKYKSIGHILLISHAFERPFGDLSTDASDSSRFAGQTSRRWISKVLFRFLATLLFPELPRDVEISPWSCGQEKSLSRRKRNSNLFVFLVAAIFRAGKEVCDVVTVPADGKSLPGKNSRQSNWTSSFRRSSSVFVSG